MLELNQSTLLLISGIKSILGSIIFYWLRISTQNISGLQLWALASLLVGLATLLDGSYVNERPVAVSLAFNICIVFGQFLFLFGTAQFVSQPFKKNWLPSILLFIASTTIIFTLIIPNNILRISILTILYGTANIWMGWILLTCRPSHARFAYITSAVVIFLQAAASITQGLFFINEIEMSLSIERWIIPAMTILWINAISTIILGNWILFLLVTFRIIDALTAMAEREERERIARDLHDTVLQTFQAFVFKTTMKLAKSDTVLADSLERSLNEAINAIHEGREKVSALRASKNSITSLRNKLHLLCEQQAKEHQKRFQFRCVGTERGLKPEVQLELCAIAQEALRNAFRHANATCHEVVIEFKSNILKMHIRDNGGGIKEIDGQKPDHWGIIGIKERAQLINAEIALHTSADIGTTWEIAVKAELAYLDPPIRNYSWLGRLFA